MANIHIQCPACQNQSMIPDTQMEKMIRCPSCKHTFKSTASMIAPPPVLATVVSAPPPQSPVQPIPVATPSEGPKTSRRNQFTKAKQKSKHQAESDNEMSYEDFLMYRVGIFMVGGGVAANLATVVELNNRGIVELISKVGPIAGTLLGLLGVGMIAYGARNKIYGYPIAGIGLLSIIICAAIGFTSGGSNQIANNQPDWEWEKKNGIKRPKKIIRDPVSDKQFKNDGWARNSPIPPDFENTRPQLPANTPKEVRDQINKDFDSFDEQRKKMQEDFEKRTGVGSFRPPRTSDRIREPFKNNPIEGLHKPPKSSPFSRLKNNTPAGERNQPFINPTPRSTSKKSESRIIEVDSSKSPTPNRTYAVGEKVQAKRGATWVAASIVKKAGEKYYEVRYEDWSSHFDETISTDRIRKSE